MTKTHQWGWGLSIAVGALMVVNGIILVFIEDSLTVPILLAGFGGLALAVAYAGYRGADWAWGTTWIVVATLLVLSLPFLIEGRFDIGAPYVILAVVGAVAQMLTRRTSPVAAGGRSIGT